jgi:mono/diheme cytochrome c family protein
VRWLIALIAIPLLAFAPSGAQSEQQGDVARGQQIYQANCAMCHGVEATGMMGMHPALTGVVERLSLEGVEVTIRNGRNTQPPMPSFDDRLDDTDIADLIAHLDSLPDGPRNFGPETTLGDGGGSPMARDGMGGMMDRMFGAGGSVALWLVVVVLTAALAGVIGYLIAARGRSGG